MTEEEIEQSIEQSLRQSMDESRRLSMKSGSKKILVEEEAMQDGKVGNVLLLINLNGVGIQGVCFQLEGRHYAIVDTVHISGIFIASIDLFHKMKYLCQIYFIKRDHISNYNKLRVGNLETKHSTIDVL